MPSLRNSISDCIVAIWSAWAALAARNSSASFDIGCSEGSVIDETSTSVGGFFLKRLVGPCEVTPEVFAYVSVSLFALL